MKNLAISTALCLALAATLAAPVHASPTASGVVAELTKEDRAKLMEKVRAGLKAKETKKTVSSEKKEPTAAAFEARGVVQPLAEVKLGAGLAARIDKLPFKDGERFQKGDELVAFDCGRQRADLRGANASLGKAQGFYNSKKRLQSRGAAGAQEVREAAADVEAAKATVDALEEVIRLCRIAAPFDGRVVERLAEPFEIPAANAPIMTIVDDSALELDLIVPSIWLQWVSEGTTFDFAVDELGQTFKARVARLGAKVDAVSQTIKLTGEFVQRPEKVLSGMSGTARFDPPTN